MAYTLTVLELVPAATSANGLIKANANDVCYLSSVIERPRISVNSNVRRDGVHRASTDGVMTVRVPEKRTSRTATFNGVCQVPNSTAQTDPIITTNPILTLSAAQRDLMYTYWAPSRPWAVVVAMNDERMVHKMSSGNAINSTCFFGNGQMTPPVIHRGRRPTRHGLWFMRVQIVSIASQSGATIPRTCHEKRKSCAALYKNRAMRWFKNDGELPRVLAAGGTTIIEAVLSSSGIATVSGVSGSIAGAPVSAGGTSTVTATASAIALTTHSSTGLATPSLAGVSVSTSLSASTGIAALSCTGRAVFATVNSSAGLASVSGTGAAIARTTHSSSGVATVTGVSGAIAGAPVNAAGTAVVSSVGTSLFSSLLNSAGIAAVSVDGTDAATGATLSSAGLANTSLLSSAFTTGVVVSSGLAALSGVGVSVSLSLYVSDGLATVSFVGENAAVGTIIAADMVSTGTSSVLFTTDAATTPEDVWHGSRRSTSEKRKAWPLPPPHFPIVEEPSALVPVLPEPPAPALPAWQRPRGRYRGMVYQAPVESSPVEIITSPAPTVRRERVILAQTTTPVRDDTWAKIKRRQRNEDELILALLMQGEL